MTMSRFCPNCGTEVDDNAVFCPTCGQPIDQAAESEMPAVPAWPEAEEPAEPVVPVGRPQESAWSQEPVPSSRDKEARPHEEMTRVEAQPGAPPPPAAARTAPARPAINLPVTMPVTLSGWLIGIGAVLAALGIVIGLFDGFLNPIELILLLALLAIAAAVFFSASLPSVPNLRLATLSVALITSITFASRLRFR